MTTVFLLLAGIILFWLFLKSREFVTKFNSMTILFIIAILVFMYLCYVLVRPEKF